MWRLFTAEIGMSLLHTRVFSHGALRITVFLLFSGKVVVKQYLDSALPRFMEGCRFLHCPCPCIRDEAARLCEALSFFYEDVGAPAAHPVC
eukprot:scaffold228455_cov21-Tisochrysis_lutea.AAC.2